MIKNPILPKTLFHRRLVQFIQHFNTESEVQRGFFKMLILRMAGNGFEETFKGNLK